MRDTIAIIKTFIVENFYVQDGATLSEDESLVETGIVDSTGVLELTAYLERTFGIAISDVEIVPENMATIGRMAAFVLRKKRAA